MEKRTKSVEMVRSWIWRYDSPMAQIVILGVLCFCCPGMFNAINGLGAVGKTDATTTDNANTALAVTFATCSLIAGAVFNILGHRLTLFLGGLAYVLYIGSYLSYASAFVITSGGILGAGAGFLWAAQGAIMISYPEEKDKGKYIGVFWSIFNTGGVMGSLIPLIIEWNSGKSSVSTVTYISFMVIMFCGTLLSLTLLPPNRVTRKNGEPVSMHQYSSWKLEATEIAKLFGDWRMLALIPMFLSSNWFYTYQFNCFNGGGLFTTRTRAFNGTFYWFAQILGSNLMGNFLDSEKISPRRKRRAEMGLVALLVIATSTWGGGYAFQRNFTRRSVSLLMSNEQKIDLTDSRRFAGPVTLYTSYGFFDALWQTYCYWIMGSLTNDTRKAARYSGFYKAVQNAGAALGGQVDAHKVSFMNQLVVNWVILTYGCVSAYLVARTVTSSSDSLDSKTVKESEGLQSGFPPDVPVSRTGGAEAHESKETHDSVLSIPKEVPGN
ncbi:hypothetical protein R1flu_022165 [Riccia fluitans]|uniref:MFS general substrate transporter n=1 Tax=Riccia fluitans TaxID=41844 RepID=A0ABD1ZSE8_9MARC